MVLYNCERCDKIFGLKGDFTRHLNRKNPCKLLLIKDQFCSHLLPINNIQSEQTTPSKMDNYKCDTCLKKFTKKSNYVRHQKNKCNSKNSLLEQLLNEMKEQKNEIKLLREQNREIINYDQSKKQKLNITQNNLQINNNFKVVGFGKEDMSYITDEMCKKIFAQGEDCLLHFIKEKHFNDNHPEHSNIYIGNWKSQLVVMFDGIDWILKFSEPEIIDMLKTSTEYLVGKYEDLKINLGKKIKKDFFSFLNKINYEFGCHDIDDVDMDNSDDLSPFIKNLLKNTKLLLYNKRKQGVKNQKMLT